MAEVARPFNDDDLLTDKISKKDLVTFLQENASSQVRRNYCRFLILILICVIVYYLLRSFRTFTLTGCTSYADHMDRTFPVRCRATCSWSVTAACVFSHWP